METKKSPFGKARRKDPNLKSTKKWMHPDSTLINHSVTYNGKYLGEMAVSKARGSDIVKSAIVKLKFSQSLNVSESGKKASKLRKIELQLSLSSLKVLDAKTKACILQRPLHRISYCADDKKDSKLFSFIAKEQDSSEHKLFAFYMEQDASAVTLTFGQAFDIAYRKFCDQGRQQMKEKQEILDVSSHVELIKNASNRQSESGSQASITPQKPQFKRWTTFDESTTLTADEQNDVFENYLYDLQRQRSANQLSSCNEMDKTSDTSSERSTEFTLENGTLFMHNEFGENENQLRFDAKKDSVPLAIAKPPSKKDIRCGKKLSWDGLEH